MAINLYSHSPRIRALDPVTPVHSPHHSVHSSTSSRTPLLSLSLHDYRKQQNSPASHSATPPGKTLRRKAAASGLNEVERIPSNPPVRPLHFSHSAHQLNSYQLPPSPPPFDQLRDLADQPLRSQSADLPSHAYTGSKVSSADSGRKTRKFKPIKRLPKPITAAGFALPPLPPAPFASVTSTHQRLSPLRTTSFPSVENPSNTETQSTPSTFSLSRFPQPPPLVNHSLSPPNDENIAPRVNPASFTTTAPATPPATPAVIHYRGASFDLVNPHDSLCFHDIETPSRDLDSIEYLPLRSSEDPLASEEMAPKRALYGDLSSAYTSIIARRNEDHTPTSLPDFDLPLPPTPVFRSRASSEYSSPFQSPDSNFAVSPLAISKRDNEPRFSLKQLTRTLTKKLGKNSEKENEEELQDLSASRASLASASFDGGFPRPLNKSYRLVTPKSESFLNDPPTPVSPLEHAIDVMSRRSSAGSIDHPMISTQRYDSAPLASMLPDSPSTQIGRTYDPQTSLSEGNLLSRPYYDDITSIYRSSSIYTGDEHGRSNATPGHMNFRNSVIAPPGGDAVELANTYKLEAVHDYASPHHANDRVSMPLTEEMPHRSLMQGNDKTDTISKFIDQYKRIDSRSNSQPGFAEPRNDNAELDASSSGAFKDLDIVKPANETRATSGLSQFDFDLPYEVGSSQNEEAAVGSVELARSHRLAVTESLGFPPQFSAPLAPAFGYDEDHQNVQLNNPSDLFSGVSSYGDTRQLLQLSNQVVTDVHSQALEPSSSYSQSEEKPFPSRVPDEALEQASNIFGDCQHEEQVNDIPVMWSRRHSGNLLRTKSRIDPTAQDVDQEHRYPMTDFSVERDVSDWETVAENNQEDQEDQLSIGESLADYSDSADDEGSLDFSSSYPVWEDLPLEPGSFQYKHPSPLGAHSHPFASSPPQLSPGPRVHTVGVDAFLTSPMSRAPASATVPAFLESHGHIDSDATSTQQYPPLTPWTIPFTLSDKETQELLASGPNEEILYEPDPFQDPVQASGHTNKVDYAASRSGSVQDERLPSVPSNPRFDGHTLERLERQNSFGKFSVLGPKGNITGTPRGTGMHEAGSSEADNSSPGVEFTSSPLGSQPLGGTSHRQTPRRISNSRRYIPSFVQGSGSDSTSIQPEFYDTPGRTTSVHRVGPGAIPVRLSQEAHDRTPSQGTLFPRLVIESRRSSRHSLRSPSSARHPHGHSRAAVSGQTKLRHMVLAPDVETLASSNSNRLSRFVSTTHSGRPSTANTHTPLRTHMSEATLRAVMASEHSPHLLCPERVLSEEEEADRRKLSWIIFAVFCILPPTLILYRFMADNIIINVTKGRIVRAHPKPKRIALPVGIAVNLSVCSAILIPILVAHATGAL